MYIRENAEEREVQLPPDYRGHTYQPSAPQAEDPDEREDVQEEIAPQESVPAGAFGGGARSDPAKNKGKRCDFFGGGGWNGLFSRVPFLSSLLPPPREKCEGEKRHSELWDWALLVVAALCLLEGSTDDVIPILLLLLLWD